MASVLVIAFFGTGASGGQSERAEVRLVKRSPVAGIGDQAAPARSECRSARRASVYYRALTWTRQRAREAELSDRTPIVSGKSCRWSRYAAGEHRARARSARLALERWLRRVLVGEAEIRAYIDDDCLEEIIDRETAGTWSPTVYNYSGSGAYGLPQALPGKKMAEAGSDWKTNPRTQVRWMRGYVNGRYGGSCAALAFHNANGWY